MGRPLLLSGCFQARALGLSAWCGGHSPAMTKTTTGCCPCHFFPSEASSLLWLQTICGQDLSRRCPDSFLTCIHLFTFEQHWLDIKLHQQLWKPILAHGYVRLTEMLTASVEAGIGPRSSNAQNSSAKCQELGDCTVQGVIAVGCRVGKG